MKYEELENLELSRSELAKLFGVTTRIVDQMRADGIITPCSEKPVRFNFVDSVRAIYKDARAKAADRKNKENPAKEVDLKIKEKKLEILTNQATIEDYRVNEIKGKYHRADDIVELLQAYNETVKGALVAMLGKDKIPFTENGVYETVTVLTTLGATIWAWWENNAFTHNARKAEQYRKDLNKEDEEEETDSDA